MEITLGTAKERFGDRIKKDGSKANPSNMKAMIKHYLNEDAHLVVIMGRHPTFIPVKYVNGERKGKQGKAVSGTSKGGASNERDIINIFQKLNDGGTKKLSTDQIVQLEELFYYVVFQLQFQAFCCRQTLV